MRGPFDPNRVRAGVLTPGMPWRDVEFHAAIGSTNERARELVMADAASPAHGPDPSWRVVTTDHQTGGRGRLGRAWEVPRAAAVAVSAILPVVEIGATAWVPFAAGLAVSRALREVTRAAGHEVTPHLKWPNDVLLADDDDRKVSGILCELVPAGSPQSPPASGGPNFVVVGAGINVDQTRDELPVPTATSIALAGVSVEREELVVSYLRQLATLWAGAAEATAPVERWVPERTPRHTSAFDLERVVRGGYEGGCSTIGSLVRVHLPGGVVVEGVATGIAASGGLVVQTGDGGERTFAAGDVVHVRRADGRLA